MCDTEHKVQSETASTEHKYHYVLASSKRQVQYIAPDVCHEAWVLIDKSRYGAQVPFNNRLRYGKVPNEKWLTLSKAKNDNISHGSKTIQGYCGSRGVFHKSWHGARIALSNHFPNTLFLQKENDQPNIDTHATWLQNHDIPLCALTLVSWYQHVNFIQHIRPRAISLHDDMLLNYLVFSRHLC